MPDEAEHSDEDFEVVKEKEKKPKKPHQQFKGNPLQQKKTSHKEPTKQESQPAHA